MMIPFILEYGSKACSEKIARMAPILNEVRQHFHNFLLTPDLIELRNLALIAELIVKSAMTRKESRGLHYMLDYPEKDDVNWRKNTVL